MQVDDNILELLRKEAAEAERRAQRGIILQPGAVGDCVLTLPLAEFMKSSLKLGSIDILGHTEYTSIFPGRSCVDGIRSIDSVELHRLFAETKDFDLADGDSLINFFAEYTWIVTFLGEADSNFEQNLIYTANCSHSSEVITLSIKPAEDFSIHITDFYIRQFVEQCGLALPASRDRGDGCLIKAAETDIKMGRMLLKEAGIDFSGKLVIIQPGSGGVHKCWHLDNFLAVAKGLIAKGLEVVFLLGPAELDRFGKEKLRNISSVAKCLNDLSLTQVLCVLSCADAFVGNDSGIGHLAAGLGVETIAVFGPTNPAVYGPVGPAVKLFDIAAAGFAERPSVKRQRQLLEILRDMLQ